MEMAGNFIEQAPNGYPYNIIKDVYIRERDKNIKNGAPISEVLMTKKNKPLVIMNFLKRLEKCAPCYEKNPVYILSLLLNR